MYLCFHSPFKHKFCLRVDMKYICSLIMINITPATLNRFEPRVSSYSILCQCKPWVTNWQPMPGC